MNDQRKYVGRVKKWIALAIGANFNPAEKPAKNKRLSTKLNLNYHNRVELSLENLKNAVDQAKYPDYPNREMLYEIYEQIRKDNHLASQVLTAKQAVLKSDFFLSKDGKKPDENATEYIKTKWFYNFIAYAIDAEFWGHSLIEFGQIVNGEFKEVKLIDRLNVIPEFGMIVSMPGAVKGIDYRKHAVEFALIEVGDRYDLGKFELAAKEVIVKNYARTDWSQSSEKFGMPRLVILTDTQDQDELDKMEYQAANFAANGYVILNKDDEVELLNDASTDRYKIYEAGISKSDEYNSKLINGQTGTSDEKAFVGSAEVHERVMDDYTESRLRSLQFVVNDDLIPFLVAWGYPLKGQKFFFSDLLKKDKETPKPAAEPGDPNNPDPPKKAIASGLKANDGRQYPSWLLNMPAEGCSH